MFVCSVIKMCRRSFARNKKWIYRKFEKIYLHCNKGKDEVSMLVGAKTSGATPLVIACRNGHYDVAEYLIEKCHAEIEQPGSVMFDGETIEGAPPLWCAAAAGHLEIVRLLLEHGAHVNSTTRTNSTPLRAACFDGHLEIVKYLVSKGANVEVANRHGHTCLMIACYKGHLRIAKFLLSLNADVNRKSVKGNTALHDCAESGSLEILKLLLESGASMDVDSYGMTPLLAAAVTGHNHIVEYLIRIPHLVSRNEKIDALELLGATYVDKKRDMIGAIEYWKRAINERYHGQGPQIPKPKLSGVPAYEHTIEIDDPEGLDDLMADPDEMRMQALVIRERILGPAHPDTSYYIRYRGAVYADAGKFNRCIELWNYALDMQQSMLERLNPMTQSSLFSFTELFSFMMGEEGKPTTRGRVVPPVNIEELLNVFYKAVNEVDQGNQMLEKLAQNNGGEKDMTYLTRVLVITLHLACLLTRLLKNQMESTQKTTQNLTMDSSNSHISHIQASTNNNIERNHSNANLFQNVISTDSCHKDVTASYAQLSSARDLTFLDASSSSLQFRVHSAIYKLVNLKITSRLGRSVLHLACCRDAALVGRYPACQFPSSYLAKVLLAVGADPNARDEEGNTPLHLAAMARPCPKSVAQILLDNGGHLDAVNKNGETFEMLLRGQQVHELVNTARHTKLTCVAARTIKQFKIPYKGTVTPALERFIADH